MEAGETTNGKGCKGKKIKMIKINKRCTRRLRGCRFPRNGENTKKDIKTKHKR